MFSDVDFTTLLIFFLVLMLTYICFRKPAGIPPGPVFTLPVLGDLPHIAATKGDMIGTLRKLREKYGNIYSFYMGRQLAIIVSGYRMIHTVAARRGMQYCGRPKNYMSEIISKGKGLGLSTGNVWKQQRHFTSKAFLKLGMNRKSCEKHITREVKAFTKVIENQKGHPFDIEADTQASTTSMIITLTIGEYGKHENIDSLRQSWMNLFARAARTLPRVSVLLNCLPFLKFIPGDPLQLRILQSEFQTTEELIKEHVVEPALKTPQKEAITFVEMYLEKIKEQENVADEAVFTFDQMNIVLNDIVGGGSETILTTIRWAILYLVNFPDIQKRLQQHIDEVIPVEKMPCLDDKAKLPYVEAFIAEVQRCANVVPLGVPRAEIDGIDTYLKGYLIPKDAAIMFDFDSIFMDDEIFKRPEVFNPDRFINESGTFETSKEFIPFSAGRRNCIGMQLAKRELFLYMANLIKTFTFLPADGENMPKICGSVGLTHAPDNYSVRCVRRI